MGTKNVISKLAFLVLILSFFIIFSTNIYSQEAKIRIVKAEAVLRLEPNPESAVIKNLPLGSEYNVEEIVGEWIKIGLLPNEEGIMITGYVHISFVRLSTAGTPKPTIQEKILPEKSEPIQIEKPKPVSSQQMDEDFLTWRNKLELAKTKKRTGRTVFWIGFGVWAIAFLGEQYAYNNYYYYDSTPYLVVYGISLGASIAGYIVSSPAAKEIKQLELEGARKGYILARISAIPKGFSIGLAFSF